MFRLSYFLEGEMHHHLLSLDRVTLGRLEGNDVVLRDHTVSRQHAELRRTPEGWLLTDLDSRNGTRVNGEPVKQAAIKMGDLICLGVVELRLEEADERVLLRPSGPQPIAEGTIIRSVDEVQAMLSAEAARPAKELAGDRLARISRIFSVLSDMAKTLIAAEEVDQVLEKALDVVFQHVPAQRGVILLARPDDGSLEPRVVRNAQGSTEPIQISQTIAEKAFREGVSILTSDAQVDPRFQAGQSIRFLGIRSALCVPLSLSDQVLGLIYVDTPLKVRAFSEFDLELLSALAGYGAMALHQAELRARILKERQAKSRLERYHSPSVASRILSAADATGAFTMEAREQEASVLFADLVGFTSLTEHMQPREVSLMLNAVFSRMTDIIFEHEGTLDKFIGDALMAIFGAPIPMDDHAVRAVSCAIEMRKALREFSGEGTGPNLLFRMGINSGRVVAGDIGSPRRLEYTVLGATVNLASRLQTEVAKPGQIVVGEGTFALLPDGLACTKLESVNVKGFSRGITAYEVNG